MDILMHCLINLLEQKNRADLFVYLKTHLGLKSHWSSDCCKITLPWLHFKVSVLLMDGHATTDVNISEKGK